MSLRHLAWRQFVAHRGVSVALALVVVAVACALTAWPRAVASMHSAQVEHELATATPLQRDVIAVSVAPPDLGPAQDPGTTGLPPATERVWGATAEGLERLRAAQPEPLRSVLGEGRVTVESTALQLPTVPGNDVRTPEASVKVDPYLTEHVTLVDGTWPGPVPPPSAATDGTTDGTTGPVTVDVVTSAEAARVLGWSVGDVHALGDRTAVRLAGTFEALDPDADYWQHNPYSAEPQVIDDLNLGRSARTALYLDPASAGRVAFPGLRTRVWYPVSGDEVQAAQVGPLLAQLRGLTASPHEVVPGGGLLLAPSSELTQVLAALLAQQRATAAVLAVVAVGPLGVTAAVLLLGARLVVARRRRSLALLAARGASGLQLRTATAAEGLALGLTAAAVGAAAAVLATPASGGGGAVRAVSFAPALLAGLAPALAFGLASSPRGLRDSRTDLGGPRDRSRWLVEVVVLAAAAVSVVLLLQRGVLAGASATVDPLLAAAPLLLALATCVVVLRVYPLPVRLLERTFRRRRGLVPFLGAARAVRDPAGGVAPALALVVGVGVAVFSAVLYSTVQGGVRAEAWATVGADLRVSGPVVDADAVDALRRVDGVAAVATVADLGELPLRHGGSGQQVSVVAVDARELARVQADVPGATALPAELAGPAADGRLPAVLASTLGLPAGTTDVRLLAERSADVDVVGTAGDVLGLRTVRAFAVVDRAAAEELLGVGLHPRSALVDLAPGADPGAVRAAVGQLLPTAVTAAVDDESADLLGSPVAEGMNRALVVAILLAGALCAAAVVLTLMIGAPARDRLVAVLRTVGLAPRQARALVAWELGPWALVALVVGAGLGVAVPALVLSTVDLTPFTGGDEQPRLAVEPLVLGAVVGGFVLVVVAAVAISTAVSRRGEVASELRRDEE